jgi:hypothetical protein
MMKSLSLKEINNEAAALALCDNRVPLFVILWSNNYDRHAILRRHVGAVGSGVAVEDSVSCFVGSPM